MTMKKERIGDLAADTDSEMIDGIEMTMGAVVNFVESLMDYAETSQEKEIVRKYVSKIKNV